MDKENVKLWKKYLEKQKEAADIMEQITLDNKDESYDTQKEIKDNIRKCAHLSNFLALYFETKSEDEH